MALWRGIIWSTHLPYPTVVALPVRISIRPILGFHPGHAAEEFLVIRKDPWGLDHVHYFFNYVCSAPSGRCHIQTVDLSNSREAKDDKQEQTWQRHAWNTNRLHEVVVLITAFFSFFFTLLLFLFCVAHITTLRAGSSAVLHMSRIECKLYQNALFSLICIRFGSRIWPRLKLQSCRRRFFTDYHPNEKKNCIL